MFGRNWVRVHLKHKETGAQTIKTIALDDWKIERTRLDAEGLYQILLVAPIQGNESG